MSGKNHKTFSVSLETAGRIEAIAEKHGVKVSVVLDALAEIAETAENMIAPFVLRAKEENAEMRRRVASERAKVSHAKRKAMQVETGRVES